MLRLLKTLSFAALLGWTAGSVSAFSLLGPATDWMTAPIGYANVVNVAGGTGAGAGGPMNIGEEYRWSVPTVYYAYAPGFKNYFGQRGIEEIEKAIQILNSLPSMDTANIDDFPLSSERLNYQAQALLLADVKSYTLSYLLQTLGITDPTRFVFTVRNRWIGPGSAPTNYFIIKRNFDPVTWEPSSFINGQLWTYTAIIDNQDAPTTDVINETVDPLALQGLINAPVTSGWVTGLLLFGGYWTGLTRDDVGGLRYIYRQNNYNIEPPVPTASRAGFGAVASGGGDNPWSLPVVTPPAGTGTGGTTVNPATNFVTTAVRPGLGAIPRFVRVEYDSQVGFYISNTVAFADRVITNGRAISQNLVRPLAFPDYIFDAGDLQQGETGPGGFVSSLNTEPTAGWITNGVPDVQAQRVHWGPGIISPSSLTGAAFVHTLQSVGPTYYSVYPFPVSEADSSRLFRWGSFDGSTNAPVVYPSGASIQELESQILGGGVGGAAGGTVSLAEIWTPSASILLPVGANTGGGTGTDTGGGSTTQ